MIRRPPRSTLDRSSAASDVYKRQDYTEQMNVDTRSLPFENDFTVSNQNDFLVINIEAVSYTHLRAHETVLDLVCRLLLEKKKQQRTTCDTQIEANIKNKYTKRKRIVAAVKKRSIT